MHHKADHLSSFPSVHMLTETRTFSVDDVEVSAVRSSFRSVGSQLFHVHGATIEKALSPIHRHDRGTTTSPENEACNVNQPRISTTGVSRFK